MVSVSRASVIASGIVMGVGGAVAGGGIVAIHAQMAEAHFELKSDVWEGSTQ